MIKRAALKALISEGRNIGQINICFVDDKTIKALNLKYLKRPMSTDVLAFDLTEGKGLSGDVAISAQTAALNAKSFSTTPLYEMCLYTAHAILHLAGYNDRTGRERQIMHRKATKICQFIGLKP